MSWHHVNKREKANCSTMCDRIDSILENKPCDFNLAAVVILMKLVSLRGEQFLLHKILLFNFVV